MKVLFIARHFTYFRNFDSVVHELAARGHEVHLAADMEEQLGGRALVDRLAAECPGVTVGFTPLRDSRLLELTTAVRLSIDYFRYLDPMYDGAPAIRARAWERTPRATLALASGPLRAAAAPILRAVERALPIDPAIQQFLDDQRPDVLLVTPLIELGSPQADYVRAARARGIPTTLCVWSWDHLSSKSLIRTVPDRVIVWNDTQRDEAVRLHGIPAERIVVTGAQCFDQWFDRAPSRSRAEFCRDAGLPDDRPYILYVCSSLFRDSPPEAPFVRRWLEHLRSSNDGALRDAAVLVRPHPQRMAQWADVALDGLGPVSLWGSSPVDAQARADYFDSLYHATTVVGLNTSALIEAALVDRPVHTILLPEFRSSQEGTLHFSYIADAERGFLRIARTLNEHVEQLAHAMQGGSEPRNHRFVQHFVRPHARPATALVVDAVESAAAVQPERSAAPAAVLRPVVGALYAVAGTGWGRRLLEDPLATRERQARDGRIAGKQALVDEHRRVRAHKEDDKRRRWRAKRRQESLVRLKTAMRRFLPHNHL